MRWLILTISLLASSNLATINNILKKEQSTKITKNTFSNKDQMTALQKVKLPLINKKVIDSTNCRQIDNNVFIYVDFQTVNSKSVANLYYIDATNMHNIIIKDCGLLPAIPNNFFKITNVAAKKIILYMPSKRSYVYIDLNDLTKPVIKEIIGPSTFGRIPAIQSINYLNKNNLIISTIDGVFTTNLSDLNHPKNYLWDCGDVGVSQLLKITDNKYLVSGVVPSPEGQITQFYLFNLTKNIHQPTINKININLGTIKNISLVKLLSSNSVIFNSSSSSLYYLKFESPDSVVLKILNMKFNMQYDRLQVMDDKNFVVATTTVKISPVLGTLWLFHVSDNIISKKIQLPPIGNVKAIFSCIYLNKNNFIVRLWFDNNELITYNLDLTNQSKPRWDDTGLGVKGYWQPLKLSSNSALLNDDINNAWIGILN